MSWRCPQGPFGRHDFGAVRQIVLIDQTRRRVGDPDLIINKASYTIDARRCRRCKQYRTLVG